MGKERTSGAIARAADAPKLGLRFDRGRTELVLDAPIALGQGLVLESMRTELAPLEGRLSLTEGWRAFRHRRSTLLAARVSITLDALAARVGDAIGLDVRALAVDASRLSLSGASESIALAAELTWGFDGEDLLVVLSGARSLPLGPRAALALGYDLGMGAGAELDRTRGALRVPQPLRALLMQALVPSGLRVPSGAGLAQRVEVQGERLVWLAERVPGGWPEASRDALERARASAALLAECIDRDGPAPPDPSPVAAAAQALHDALGAERPDAELVATSAADYAARERHASMASIALMLAAERADGSAARLALRAIERGGLTRAESLARAIELVALGSARGGAQPSWDQLARSLDASSPAVTRARGLALARADRPADALALFAEVLRSQADDVIALGGTARALDALGRHDEAIRAWDRLAALVDGPARAEAQLAAASATRALGHVDGAIARLRELVSAHRRSEIALRAQAALAEMVAAHTGLQAALELDRSLAALTDAVGGVAPMAAASCLRDAIARALEAGEPALARAHVQALERVLGVAGEAEYAAHARAIADAEARALTAGDPATLRQRADALRASGQHADAARVLVEIFAQTKDAAVLRAAIELADLASDRAARLAVFDRALALLPPGAARDAIAARR